jgi:hypothetical protein
LTAKPNFAAHRLVFEISQSRAANPINGRTLSLEIVRDNVSGCLSD